MMEETIYREVLMAATKAPKPRAPRRHWPPAEKRRIVELTLRAGASLGAIAHDHGVHPNSLGQWKALYRAGKLDAQVKSAPRLSSAEPRPTFVPVSLVPAMRRPQPAARPDATAGRTGIVQLVLASGATLRVETDALDAALVCALVAELQR
jgi:transposase-like protein